MKIELLCFGCKKQVGIKPDDGVVHFRYSDGEKYRVDMEAWEKEYPAENGWTPRNFDTMPRQAQWMIHCDDCNPHEDGNGGLCAGCYWYDAIRCNTPAKLLHHTAHLMEKNWLKYSNWSDFIRPFGEAS